MQMQENYIEQLAIELLTNQGFEYIYVAIT
jgi:hypothetical protein